MNRGSGNEPSYNISHNVYLTKQNTTTQWPYDMDKLLFCFVLLRLSSSVRVGLHDPFTHIFQGYFSTIYSQYTCTVKSLIWVHQIPQLKCFSSRLAIVFAQPIEARREVQDENVVGAAPTGAAPTTSEWTINLLPIKVHLILEIWR